MHKETAGSGQRTLMHAHLTTAIAFCLGNAFLIPAAAQDRPGNKDGLIESTGTVVPARTVDISPRFDGLLIKINFVPGQFVEKGALLFEFEPSEYQLRLERDRAKLKRAEAQLRVADLLLDNKRKLRVHSVACEMQVREAEAARDIAAADASEALSAVAMAEAAVRDMKLYAPISGVISRAFVTEGTYITKVARPQSSLAQITQRDPIGVVSQVPRDAYVAAGEVLRSGRQANEELEVSLVLPDGGKFPLAGRIAGRGYELIPETRTIEIMSEFPNPHDLLRPGQTVTLQFKTKNALSPLGQPVALHRPCSHPSPVSTSWHPEWPDACAER